MMLVWKCVALLRTLAPLQICVFESRLECRLEWRLLLVESCTKTKG